MNLAEATKAIDQEILPLMELRAILEVLEGYCADESSHEVDAMQLNILIGLAGRMAQGVYSRVDELRADLESASKGAQEAASRDMLAPPL